MPVKVQQEVKEAQSSQASLREGGRPYELERYNSGQIDQEAADLAVPWVDVMNELSSVRQSCQQLSLTKDTSEERGERGQRD